MNSFSRSGGNGSALCHIERDGLRYLVPVSGEVNPLFAFAFLESFLDTLREYLGEVTEGTVKDNFDIVYMVSYSHGVANWAQLIEEMLDEGHPMTMETNMLKDIVMPPSLVRKLLNVAGVSGYVWTRVSNIDVINSSQNAEPAGCPLHRADTLAPARRATQQQRDLL